MDQRLQAWVGCGWVVGRRFKSYIFAYMKTSRTNSFRLHRINKTGSLRKASQTFYDPDESFKLAALNSVSRGVKHADLSFLTGNDLHKLRVEPLEPNEGEYNSAHHNLTEVRRRYDEMKKERLALEEKIEREKEEIGKLSIFRAEYEGKIGEAKSRAAALQEQLEEKRTLLEVTATERKVLVSMEGRHRADKVFYDQRRFDLEKELSYLRKQTAIFRREGHGIGEEEDRTGRVYERLAREVEAEREEREAHVRNLETMIEEKLQLLNTNQLREADLHEIAERAIQDKDLNEKNWRKIFLTHVFVNRMLRNKIEKEMEKFRVVELAFKHIKTATGVSDAKHLVHKYLNKEAVYGELLGKIADNEKTIDHHKTDTERLIQDFKTLEIEREVLHSVKIRSQDLHDSLKQLGQFDEKAATAETYQNKVAQWTHRQLRKLTAADRTHEEPELPRTTDHLKDLLNKLLGVLSREAEQAPEAAEEAGEPEGLASRDNEKNTRIVPKKSRLNSSGEEIFDVEEEESSANVQAEEMELINAQRDELLRTNEKFMREVKRRHDDDRRLLLEKNESKKEKPKAPEPKKDD